MVSIYWYCTCVQFTAITHQYTHMHAHTRTKIARVSTVNKSNTCTALPTSLLSSLSLSLSLTHTHTHACKHTLSPCPIPHLCSIDHHWLLSIVCIGPPASPLNHILCALCNTTLHFTVIMLCYGQFHWHMLTHTHQIQMQLSLYNTYLYHTVAPLRHLGGRGQKLIIE